MRSTLRSSFEFLSMSTLDLFASILGTFVLITFVLLPYYLEQPFLEQDIAQAQAKTSTVTAELEIYREQLTAAQAARSDAEAALAAAQDRLASAKAMAAAQPAPVDENEPAPSPLPTPFAIRDLDLVFVMDTTGSMRNELADVQANLLGVIRVLARLAPSLRVGFVAFKDRGDAYVTLAFPLTPMTPGNVAQVIDFVDRMSADGGGDDPEPVDEALTVATAMPWRSDAQGRILVVGEETARPSGRVRALELADRFRSSSSDRARPRTVSAIFTGESPRARLFYEEMARAGGGDFSAYQGQIIENVLLSVLNDPNQQPSDRAQ
jgi:von Willebrand factor type A domain